MWWIYPVFIDFLLGIDVIILIRISNDNLREVVKAYIYVLFEGFFDRKITSLLVSSDDPKNDDDVVR